MIGMDVVPFSVMIQRIYAFKGPPVRLAMDNFASPPLFAFRIGLSILPDDSLRHISSPEGARS